MEVVEYIAPRSRRTHSSGESVLPALLVCSLSKMPSSLPTVAVCAWEKISCVGKLQV
jgi:hypothetical protein